MTAITCAGCQHAFADSALFCPNCGTPKARSVGEGVDGRGASPAGSAAEWQRGLIDPLLGKLLGDRFLVQARLGQGASGTIYRAEHVTLRRKVAIKVLHAELSRDDLAVERFRREATTVAEIDNEHIVEIHDFGRAPDGRLYLAMELLEGETLDAVLARDKQLSVERAADILIQLGEALMEAHAIGYVHRDLRPRNIYLSVRRGKANFIKLLDFGLAKLVETEGQAASTSLGMTFGDARYMSPEQARGDRIDRRADIYQLGCVAYEMLTGEPPFAGHRVFDILTKQVTEAPQPLPTRRRGVPLWMEAAVAKMLAKDPDDRFATTTRMVEALRRGLETGEVMEDEIARRRESIPPPSVSRVMQRMGIPAEAKPVAPVAAAPVAAAPVAAAPVAAAAAATPAVAVPAPIAPEPPAAAMAVVPPVLPGTDPNVTMRAPIAPPPKRPAPDSVELLRKRTGTPRVGVPIVPDAPETQAPVAGEIAASAPHAPVAKVPSAPVAVASVGAAPVAAPVASVGAAPVAAPVASPASALATTTAASHNEPQFAAALGASSARASVPSDDLNISQAWYAEGEQLDGDDDAPGRTSRTRRPARNRPDITFDDELPRRRWGLIAGIGGFVLLGGIVAIAMTRGDGASSKPAPAPVAQAAPTLPEAAPSTIVNSEPETPAPAPAPTTASKPTTAKRAAASDDARPTRAPATREAFPIPGAEPTRRVPGGATTQPSVPVATPTPPAPVGPSPNPAPAPASPPSLTDSPKDPYGEEAPTDGVAPEKKAEFFANLGAQQLSSGDTAGAATNFKKALELDAKSPTAIAGMGEIALRQGLFGDAIAHLTRASRLAPRNPRVLTSLGEAYLGAGNNAQAAAQFKKALQIDPDNARARDGYNEASSRVAPADDE